MYQEKATIQKLASDIEDDPLIEEGIILRVLPDIQAEYVKSCIESGDYSKISIKWKGERHAIVRINGYQYGAILVNLPSIIEANKSVDRKNLLKAFDVSQMLLCVSLVNREEEVFTLKAPDTEDLILKHFEEYKKEILERRTKSLRGYNSGPLTDAESKNIDQIVKKGYDYRHGITPPLYNVRNRRFRRKLTGNELEYVEKTVEMLLKQDADAEEFNYELVDDKQIMQKSNSAIDLQQEVDLFGQKEDINIAFEDHEDLELELEQALQESDIEDEASNEASFPSPFCSR